MTISNEDLEQMIKDGYFFNFCCGFAMNKGFKDEFKNGKPVEFMVGDYKVEFLHKETQFQINHKDYFARMILAGYTGTHFIGDNEQEVINELLAEFQKEISAYSERFGACKESLNGQEHCSVICDECKTTER